MRVPARWRAGLFFVGILLSFPCLVCATQYEYDALNRLTKVTYDNGHAITYTYDPAGNIIQVATVGRDSASLCATLATKKKRSGKHIFVFTGSQGEAVTLRLEANPREAGLGRSAQLELRPVGRKGTPQKDGSILPNEFTQVSPYSGQYFVYVSGYKGGYCLTLEASEGTCASFRQLGGGQ